MGTSARLALFAIILCAPPAQGMDVPEQDLTRLAQPLTDCYWSVPARGPFLERILKYSELAKNHRLRGLASYYSGFFDGRKTANGEIFRNRNYSAAHLTLPLGSWVEITARATGRSCACG
jgi:hypothetical protein